MCVHVCLYESVSVSVINQYVILNLSTTTTSTSILYAARRGKNNGSSAGNVDL